ncbi:MAG: hypothetical protein FJ318_08190 [SAR202 cluster bacterium]|nr:hypothetical protein [SAR202 cluster bacterium]
MRIDRPIHHSDSEAEIGLSESRKRELEEVNRHRGEAYAPYLHRVEERNADPGATVDLLGMEIDYAADTDVLYLTIGKAPRSGVTVAVEPIVVLVDPSTLEVVALEIPFFSKKIEKDILTGYWATMLDQMRRTPRFVFAGASERDTVVRNLRAAISA